MPTRHRRVHDGDPLLLSTGSRSPGLRSEETLLHAEQLLSTGHLSAGMGRRSRRGALVRQCPCALGCRPRRGPAVRHPHPRRGPGPAHRGAMLVTCPQVWLLVAWPWPCSGLLPRAMGAAWAAMAAFFVVGLLSASCSRMPCLGHDSSPFQQTPTCRQARFLSFAGGHRLARRHALSIGVLAFGAAGDLG